MSCRIAVCDDNPIDAAYVEKLLNIWAHERGIYVSVEIFPSAEAFLFCYEEDKAFLRILEEKTVDTELSSRIYLFQGIPKGDKMEWIIQKAVELGVHEVIPVDTIRTVVKLDEKKAAKKTARWQQIAESAAKQSGRGFVPHIHPVCSFRQALEYGQQCPVRWIPYEKAQGMEDARERVRSLLPGQDVAVFIGPEGGFDEREAAQAQSMGYHPMTLGRRILRTETAGLALLSVLMFHLDGRQGGM